MTAIRARTWLAALAVAALAAGCSTSGEDPAASGAAGADGGSQAGAGAGGIGDITSTEYFNVVVGDRVFFETDRFDLDAEAQATLTQQAEWLRNNPGVTATIEGHADERGTRDYNLALGARRANSVVSFLVAQGVERGRLEAVSYGKERPVALCSEPRCWSQNRRAVTVIARGPTS
jgi:peptidoglycan-associated lipoprotein